MRRKAILTLAALLMVVSGVAAVSAYEAHTINVKAHVENAIVVDTEEIDFGIVFPEEVLIEEALICLSTSANESLGDGNVSGNLSSVDYKVFAEYKLLAAGTQEDAPQYWTWLGEYLWVGDENTPDPDCGTDNISGIGWVNVGPEPDATYVWEPNNLLAVPDPMAAEVVGFASSLDVTNKCDMLRVMLLTPAFGKSYNPYTDAFVKPEWFQKVIADELWPLLDGDGSGTDLGVDLKIQVTGINRNS